MSYSARVSCLSFHPTDCLTCIVSLSRDASSIPGRWKETQSPLPTIVFESIDTPVLERVIQYFYYKHKYDHSETFPPKFQLDTDSLVALLLAANYLDV